jgi:hypothetical protein
LSPSTLSQRKSQVNGHKYDLSKVIKEIYGLKCDCHIGQTLD